MNECKKDHFLTISFNNNCMLRCQMCQMWKGRERLPDEISAGEFKVVIQSLKQLRGNGLKGITFSGGEPLAGPGVLDLVQCTVREDFFTVMSSNGYLIDSDMAKQIGDSQLHAINLSLDSYRQKTHDFLRGVDGSFAQVMKAMEYLSEFCNNLSIGICTVITKHNLEDLMDLIDWVQQDKRIDGIAFQAVVQPFNTIPDNCWHKNEEFAFLWPKDMDKVDYVLDRLINLKKEGYKISNPPSQFQIFKSYFRYPERFIKSSRCNLGYNSVSVNTSGKIFLCLSMEPVGDIRDGNDIGKLWFSESSFYVRKQIKECQKNCKSMINCFFEAANIEGLQ